MIKFKLFFLFAVLFFVCTVTYGQVTEKWAAIYNGFTAKEDYTTAEVCDQIGNVYVTGSRCGSTGYGDVFVSSTIFNAGENYDDYVTIKHSQSGFSGPLSVVNEKIPSGFKLYQNYPNPFNPSTTIKYIMPGEDNVEIRIFDLTGKQVAELVNAGMQPGVHEVSFNASNPSSGTYLYKIETSGFTDVKKMMLVK